MRSVLAGAVLASLLLLAACSSAAPTPPAPSADAVPRFPAVAGAVLERTELARDDWRIRIRVDDADSAYAAAKRRLVAAGYVLTKDRSGRGGGDGQACTSSLCVSFGATAVDGTTTLTYEVFRGGGIVG